MAPLQRSVSLRTRTTASGLSRCHTAPDPGEFQKNLEKLKKQYSQLIVKRLQECGIQTAYITEHFLRFATPSDRTPEAADHSNWLALANQPMTVSDETLTKLFRLQEVNSGSCRPRGGTCIYYVRSFHLTVGELLGINGLIERERILVPECREWAKQVEHLEFDDDVWVRYIGCSMTTSGYGRTCQDISDPTRRLFSLFLRGWKEFFGEPLLPNGDLNSAIRVFEFTNATTEVLSRPLIRSEQTSPSLREALPSNAEIDVKEQILIQVFSISTLLNRDIGGRRIYHERDNKTKALFRRLNTNFFAKLSDEIRYQPPSIWLCEAIDRWMQKLQKFAFENEYKLDDAHAASWARQAYSATYHTWHLFVILGAEPPKHAIEGAPSTVWMQRATSIDMLAEMLRGLRVLETGDPDAEIRTMIEYFQFPWIDVRYWQGEVAGLNPELAKLAREYVATARPLAVLALGDAGAIPATNFVHPVRRNWHVFHTHSEAGKINLHHWSSDLSAPSDEQYFISLTCPHPAGAAYQNKDRSRLVLRIVDMCLWKFLLLIDIFCTLVTTKDHANRKVLCIEAAFETNKRWDETGLDQVLEQLKKDFDKAFSRSPPGRGVFLSQISGTALSFALQGAENDAVIARINWVKPTSTEKELKSDTISFHLPRHVCAGGTVQSRRADRLIEM